MLKVHLGTVNITEKTKALMNEALDAGIISQGKYTRDFEDAIKEKFSASYALCTASGTAADTVLLAALKYLHPGKDEIILPALTFIAHANAIFYNQLKPVFVDVGDDFQIDVSQIESRITQKTLAIMPVNLLGSFCDVQAIMEMGKRRGVRVIMDDCEAFGSRYKNKAAGTEAEAGTYSFFASHTICCAEGGMVVTNDKDIADLIFALRNHGRKSDDVADKFVFPWVGFNGKMNSMEAIIGLGAFPYLDEYIEKRRHNYAVLRDGLGVDLLPDTNDIFVTPHCFPIFLKDEAARDKALRGIFEGGVECRKLYSSIPSDENSYRYLGHTTGDFPRAENLSHRGLFLPIHQNLTEEDLVFIIAIAKPFLA